MKSYALYRHIREFAEEINWEERDDDKNQETIEKAVGLGIYLLADIGESLCRIADVVEEQNNV